VRAPIIPKDGVSNWISIRIYEPAAISLRRGDDAADRLGASFNDLADDRYDGVPDIQRILL
jgi:hypothetical protein